MNVKLNKIKKDLVFVSKEKIDAAFDFYLIENEKAKFEIGRRIFDSVDFNDNILAVQFTGGASFLLMLKKDINNDYLISQFIKAYNDENDQGLKRRKLSIFTAEKEYSLVQLMLNALAKGGIEKNMSNVAGKLLYFSAKTETDSQIFCVEIKLEEDYLISLKGITFTRDLKEGYINYVLQSNNTMRLKTKDDKNCDYYSIRQFPNRRHVVPFFDNNPEFYNSSKVSILNKVIKAFNKRYEGMAHLEIEDDDGWEKIDVKNSVALKKDHLRNLKTLLENKKIRIVNGIKNPLDAQRANTFCNTLKDQIVSLFSSNKYFTKGKTSINFKISVGKSLGKEDLNILVIHNKEYYEKNKEKDPYTISDDRIIQHITIEDYSTTTNEKSINCYKPKESAAPVIINELLIKADLKKNDGEKVLSLCDWKDYSFTKPIIFCDCYQRSKTTEERQQKKSPPQHYIFMKIYGDGSFDIAEVKDIDDNSFIDKETFNKVASIFKLNNSEEENHNKYWEKYKALIINEDGDINIIQDSRLKMYPNIDELDSVMEKGKMSRSNTELERLLLGAIDIHYKENPNDAYYSVGVISHGTTGKLTRASRIRKIVPYEDSKIFWKSIVETMNVTFVRNGQLTVFPFPFKYLHEYENMIGLPLIDN